MIKEKEINITFINQSNEEEKSIPILSYYVYKPQEQIRKLK